MTKLVSIAYDFPTYLNIMQSGSGTLFPPHCLSDDVFNEKRYMAISPTNDEPWFNLMGALKGFRINVVDNRVDKLNLIPGTDEVGLYHFNNYGENRVFFVHLKNILNEYPKLKKILWKEWLDSRPNFMKVERV